MLIFSEHNFIIVFKICIWIQDKLTYNNIIPNWKVNLIQLHINTFVLVEPINIFVKTVYKCDNSDRHNMFVGYCLQLVGRKKMADFKVL